MSFDKIFDLTAGVYFYFYKITNDTHKPTHHIYIHLFILLHPFYYPRTTLALSPVVTQIRGHIADPPLPSPPGIITPSFYRSRRVEHFVPSSTRVELYQPMLLLGDLSSWSFFFFSLIFANKFKSHHGGNGTQGPTLVVFEGNHRPPGRPASIHACKTTNQHI